MTDTPTPPPSPTPQPTPTPAPTSIWPTPTAFPENPDAIAPGFLEDMRELDLSVQMDDFTAGMIQGYNHSRDFFDIAVGFYVAFMVAIMFFSIMKRISNL